MLEEKRELTGAWAVAARILSALLPLSTLAYVLQILPELGVVIYKEQFLAFFLTLSLALLFMIVPARKGRESGSGAVPWYDLILIAAALGAGGYTALYYHVLLPQIGLLTFDKILASTVGIALLLEATRRCAGWTMVLVGAGALAYAYFGHFLSGMFETRVIRFDRLMQYNFMAQDAIHGIPLYVASTIVAAFMLFGQILFMVGGGKAISDFAFALMGRRRGGPAKVSVVASALFGSLSGSASANVATTGMVTIPMMKDTGYDAHKAGAIEAVASTGGLILPPIMAATGFIMAEFLAIPYAEVAIAALMPALLFYFCVFIQVDLEAAKAGLVGWRGADLPPLKPALKAVVPFAVPVAVLLYSLFGLYQRAEFSAFMATAATLLVSLAFPHMRQELKRFFQVLSSTGEAIVYVAVICGIAGLVMGCLGITGLGGSLSQNLVRVAGGEVWLLLLMAALGSIVLGMGVPVTATYIILVVLVGPALVNIGVNELAAHMFVFYFGTLSFLTPPVCISVFVAAAIARAQPMRTAFFAMRLAIVAYIIPFLFVFNEGFLLNGSYWGMANAAVGATAGVTLLSVGIVGYLAAPLPMAMRAAMVAAGLAAFAFGAANWIAAAAAWLIVGVLYLVQVRRRRPLVSSAPGPGS